MLLISALAAVMFCGGWLSPFQGLPPTPFIDITAELRLAVHQVERIPFPVLWFRATFPRYRYDQIMRLGWKALIPVTIVWLFVEGIMVYFKVGPWAS